jgi:hypothetical protein
MKTNNYEVVEFVQLEGAGHAPICDRTRLSLIQPLTRLLESVSADVHRDSHGVINVGLHSQSDEIFTQNRC